MIVASQTQVTKPFTNKKKIPNIQKSKVKMLVEVTEVLELII